MAKTLFTCPLCRSVIRDDETVTLVIKGFDYKIMHFKCYADMNYKEQQKKKEARILTDGLGMA